MSLMVPGGYEAQEAIPEEGLLFNLILQWHYFRIYCNYYIERLHSTIYRYSPSAPSTQPDPSPCRRYSNNNVFWQRSQRTSQQSELLDTLEGSLWAVCAKTCFETIPLVRCGLWRTEDDDQTRATIPMMMFSGGGLGPELPELQV